MADFYPSSMDARAAWHANWAAQLTPFIGKYGLGAGIMTEVNADNDWMQYWVAARHEAENLSQQLTKYFNAIAGNDDAVEPPNPISFALSGSPPDDPPPGIEARVRALVKQIKGHKHYSEADGEILGIVASADEVVEPTAPEFTVKTLASFDLEITFKKKGMDGVKFQFRRAGGAWQSAGILLASPGVLSITPAVPDVAEQIELRAIYLVKNTETGDYSDAKPAFIAL